MKTVKELLVERDKLDSEILEYFNDEETPLRLPGSPEDYTGYFWDLYSTGSIGYDNSIPDLENGEDFDYLLSVRGTPFFRKEYSLFKVSDDFGEQFYAIFDNSKKVKF